MSGPKKKTVAFFFQSGKTLSRIIIEFRGELWILL